VGPVRVPLHGGLAVGLLEFHRAHNAHPAPHVARQPSKAGAQANAGPGCGPREAKQTERVSLPVRRPRLLRLLPLPLPLPLLLLMLLLPPLVVLLPPVVLLLPLPLLMLPSPLLLCLLRCPIRPLATVPNGAAPSPSLPAARHPVRRRGRRGGVWPVQLQDRVPLYPADAPGSAHASSQHNTHSNNVGEKPASGVRRTVLSRTEAQPASGVPLVHAGSRIQPHRPGASLNSSRFLPIALQPTRTISTAAPASRLPTTSDDGSTPLRTAARCTVRYRSGCVGDGRVSHGGQCADPSSARNTTRRVGEPDIWGGEGKVVHLCWDVVADLLRALLRRLRRLWGREGGPRRRLVAATGVRVHTVVGWYAPVVRLPEPGVPAPEGRPPQFCRLLLRPLPLGVISRRRHPEQPLRVSPQLLAQSMDA
jgi:hypothetical protein